MVASVFKSFFFQKAWRLKLASGELITVMWSSLYSQHWSASSLTASSQILESQPRLNVKLLQRAARHRMKVHLQLINSGMFLEALRQRLEENTSSSYGRSLKFMDVEMLRVSKLLGRKDGWELWELRELKANLINEGFCARTQSQRDSFHFLMNPLTHESEIRRASV